MQGTNNKFPYIRSDLLMNYRAFRNYIDNEPDLVNNHLWTPRGNLDGTGQYRPEDISDINERNESAYLRLDFGSDIGSGLRCLSASRPTGCSPTTRMCTSPRP